MSQKLNLFKKAAKEIPAYAAFLKAQNCDPESIKTEEDLKGVPLTSKKDYLQTAAHVDLMWPSSLKGPIWYCSTSGSTGEPYYFARGENLAIQASWMAEEFLKNSSHGGGRTLVLMGFGMGVWIGGTFTLRAFEIAATRTNAPVSFLATGYNKPELFKAIKALSPEFDQTIIAGYPPFIKEVVDEAEGEGIDLKKLNIRLMFAAEAFTERFRDYVSDKAGVSSPYLDTMNIYGTADVGAMAYETPLSILVRKLALEDPLLYKDLFGQIEKTPTLAQYNPEFIDFEVVDDQIVLTGDSAIPLIRYRIGDKGGIQTYDHIEQLFSRYGVDLRKEIDRAGIGHTLSRRPFVFVYERIDLSATLHGIIIYPEFVKEGLLERSMAKYFTERFTMATKLDVHHNQFIQVNVELQKGVEPSDELVRKAVRAIKSSMKSKSSEFAEISKSKASANLVKVILWPNGHPRYFSPGTKQKWVEKL